MTTVYINKQTVEIDEGSTIFEAAAKAGIKIPTLCHVENQIPKGACRVCMVDVEGARNMVASCTTPVTEGMKITTNSRNVREARKFVVELLISEHCGECKTCVRNEDCELQRLATEMGIMEIAYPGETLETFIDDSTPALVRDSGKCIKCRRCMTVCNEIQGIGALFAQGRGFESKIGPAFDQQLDGVVCVQCGQCAAICPVGAITEKEHIDYVWDAIEDPSKFVVVQTAPAIRAALGECFDYEPGTLVTGKMVTALRLLGFDRVFDTNFTADLTIMEEGTELLTRLKQALVDKQQVALPQFTSCSPGWIKYAEYFYPELLDNISTCKSPQQMFGALAKTYYAKARNLDPETIVSVSVMPCTAKKFEASRPEMHASGYRDVDYVLTTRELAIMIKQAGIDFLKLEEIHFDRLMGESTGAGVIFGATGGVMEAALRTVYELVTGRDVPFENLDVIPVRGMDGVKEASLKIENPLKEWEFLDGVELKCAVAHGLVNAGKVMDSIRSGQSSYHFVEFMACPGGCLGGGGQPIPTSPEIRQKRAEAIYAEDAGMPLRKSHQNPEVIKIYKDFLDHPLSEKSHHLLHTHYTPRQRF